jgi:Transglutaminase-like superfamily
VLPFRVAIRFGCVPVGPEQRQAPEDIVSAIETAARVVPWRAVCIHKGLAAQRMLRAAGANAILHYGARHREDDGKLEAHVWVTIGEHAVIGGEEAPAFALVATYP